MLTLGGVGAVGLALPQAATAMPAPLTDRNCIFIFLNGGPSQFETFDPKPEQTADIRGPYGAIETNVSGIRISELLPRLSRQAHRYSIIRSLTHRFDIHSPHHTLTGTPTGSTTMCAVATMVRGARGTLPPFVRLGVQMVGVGGGRLGAAYDPVHVPDPLGGKVALPDFDAPQHVGPPRQERRIRLMQEMEQIRRAVDREPVIALRDESYRKALSILTSEEVHRAFDLQQEPDRLRDAYGANKFGQSCILARRLIEAGTRFVEIKWFGEFSGGSAYDAWDLHGAELPGLQRMETQLCPRFDHAMSTLLADLDERGLLDSTLVVAVGEFGRTPRINSSGGRDHWPACQAILISGAGVPRGTVIGESDAQGAYPASRPVSLPDFTASIYHQLGLNPNLDDRIRPFAGNGQPIPELS